MLRSALVWSTEKGRELIRVVEGSKEATILTLTLGESDLRELAKYATEAADQLAAFREDAA